MVWFRVDDGWHSHPKVIGVSLAARGLWATAGSWCGQHLTDGAVPTKMLRAWGGTPKLAKELIDAGLWEQTGTGYQFHGWSDLNPVRSDVLKARDADAKRKKGSDKNPNGTDSESGRSPPGTKPDSNGSPSGTSEESKSEPHGIRSDSSRALPRSRPDPTRPDPTESAARSDAHAAGSQEFPQSAKPDVLLWQAWERVMCNGMPGGSRPREDVFNALFALDARGWKPDRFEAAIRLWVENRRSDTGPKFEYFARDIAGILDGAPKRVEPTRNVITAPSDYRPGEA